MNFGWGWAFAGGRCAASPPPRAWGAGAWARRRTGGGWLRELPGSFKLPGSCLSQQEQQHHKLLFGMHTVGEMGGHVSPRAGAGLQVLLAEDQAGASLEEMKDRRGGGGG